MLSGLLLTQSPYFFNAKGAIRERIVSQKPPCNMYLYINTVLNYWVLTDFVFPTVVAKCKSRRLAVERERACQSHCLNKGCLGSQLKLVVIAPSKTVSEIH